MSKPNRRNPAATEVERLREQLKFARRHGAFGFITTVSCELLKTSRTLGPCFFAWLVVRDFPRHPLQADISVDGKITVESTSLADALAGILTDNLLVTLCLVIGVVAVTYGKVQATLRRDEVQRLLAYKQKYEKFVGAQRPFGRLPSNDDTRPEDE